MYGGIDPVNMIEILHGGLHNDSEPETFPLRFRKRQNSVPFPCQYIKIVPISAWGGNFNYSIWYVELRGIANSDAVTRVYQNYTNVSGSTNGSLSPSVCHASFVSNPCQMVSKCAGVGMKILGAKLPAQVLTHRVSCSIVKQRRCDCA